MEFTYTRAQLLAAIEAERHACSIAVWMTLQDALERGSDDKGLDGWMREAEQRIKDRANLERCIYCGGNGFVLAGYGETACADSCLHCEFPPPPSTKEQA